MPAAHGVLAMEQPEVVLSSLSTEKVVLTKGDRPDPTATPVSRLRIVVTWEGIDVKPLFGKPKPKNVDADAAVWVQDIHGDVIVAAAGDSKNPFRDGSLEHGGDAKGRDAGEEVLIDLDRLPDEVQSFVVCATLKSGYFADVKSLTCAVYDNEDLGSGPVPSDTKPKFRKFATIAEDKCAVIIAVCRRGSDPSEAWEIQQVQRVYSESARHWRQLEGIAQREHII